MIKYSQLQNDTSGDVKRTKEQEKDWETLVLPASSRSDSTGISTSERIQATQAMQILGMGIHVEDVACRNGQLRTILAGSEYSVLN